MILEYEKKRDDAIAPTRSNPSDAGLDVYFCPADGNAVTLQPGQSHLFNTGLSFGVPHGYMLQVMNRSSMAAKHSVIVGAHCVDSGYEGEVFIDLHNVGTSTQVFKPGKKIAQVVLVPVVHFRVQESTKPLYEYPISISERRQGALGSTD